jgi:predicted Holliday junction resolvase-like endonuclease
MEQQLTHSLLEYGILGIAVLVLGYVVYQQWKNIVRKNQELEAKITELQNDMRRYLEHDRNELVKAMEHNTQAFLSLQETIVQLLQSSPRGKGKQSETV